jgi:hypothetical protein
VAWAADRAPPGWATMTYNLVVDIINAGDLQQSAAVWPF